MRPVPHTPQTLGLALGSGGARGWAHLGVLRRLRELGIRPQCVAGTSAGAIAGALYASDSVDTMEDLATHLDWKQVAQLFLEVNFPRSGLLTGKNVMKLLKSVIRVHAFSSLNIPFAAVATDLENEKEAVFRSGSLYEALRASISIPGIFTPTLVNGRHLVDGGLVNPLPVSVCRAMGADLVIAVDVNLRASPEKRAPAKKPRPSAQPQRITQLLDSLSSLMPERSVTKLKNAHRWLSPTKREAETLSIFDVLTRSFRLVENQITRRELALNPPDLLIQPEVGDLMTLDFHRGPEAIAAGIRAVDEVLPQLQSLLPLSRKT
jgi:NTE family protein